MKKFLLLMIAVMLVVAAFFLINVSESDGVSETVSSPVTQAGDAQETDLSQPAAASSDSGSIPLPNPDLSLLSREDVAPYLHALFGWKDIGGYLPRRRLVQALENKLSLDEVQALLMFVRSSPEEVGLSDEDFNGVGDVVLLKLEEQEPLPQDYTDHLAVMFYDESLNAKWRDYCIQHLGTVYPRTPEAKRPVIDQLYEDAIKPGSQFAGTALLSMKRSTAGNSLSKEWVAEKAMSVADSTEHSDAERLSALAVAAKFNDPDAIKLAREIAPSKRSVTFRMASLAVIGAHGDESDRPLLEQYINSSDIRLRTAASEALKNLNRQLTSTQ